MMLLDNAERNQHGDLIYKHTVTHQTGDTSTREVNVTKLLSPGVRRTGDAHILILEAERADQGSCPTNPAIPADQKTAREVMRTLQRRGIEPAWKICPAADYPPATRGDE